MWIQGKTSSPLPLLPPSPPSPLTWVHCDSWRVLNWFHALAELWSADAKSGFLEEWRPWKLWPCILKVFWIYGHCSGDSLKIPRPPRARFIIFVNSLVLLFDDWGPFYYKRAVLQDMSTHLHWYLMPQGLVVLHFRYDLPHVNHHFESASTICDVWCLRCSFYQHLYATYDASGACSISISHDLHNFSSDLHHIWTIFHSPPTMGLY